MISRDQYSNTEVGQVGVTNNKQPTAQQNSLGTIKVTCNILPFDFLATPVRVPVNTNQTQGSSSMN